MFALDPRDSAAAANANIARHLSLMAQARPGQVALKVPVRHTPRGIDYLALTFAELEQEVASWRSRLAAGGIRRGDRTLVMVRQGLPLIASVFALFQVGAVPVVIDPGMGLKSFLACVERSRPRALVGIPLGQLLSRVFRRAFKSVQARVTASSALTARLGPRRAGVAVEPVGSAPGELAAILFTSGSTGDPKGVCYEHGMFDAQVRLIRETYAIEPGEIDLPLLPIFALFNPALGMTTIVPEIDPRRPAALDPEKIVRAIRQEAVTNSFGSPTLWGKISRHCAERGIALPTLRRVLCAGAAVPQSLWRESSRLLPRGGLHSPYGATEALPVASVALADSESDSVRGACVGFPLPGIDVRIIAVSDAPIATWAEVRELPPGEVGEIVVRGPVVTRCYDGLPDATAAAKIAGGDSDSASVWHRMGDCGFFDERGRLWFCGRKAERVEARDTTLFTEPCEQVFRRHRAASRCALVGLGERGEQLPALVVEADVAGPAAAVLAAELRDLGRTYPHTRDIMRFFFCARFPVDVRHNAKIHRLTLAQWAAGREAVTVA